MNPAASSGTHWWLEATDQSAYMHQLQFLCESLPTCTLIIDQ